MIVHTYPVGDLIKHDTDGGNCPCGPTIEAVFRDDGSNGWQVIHHGLDGRERAGGGEVSERMPACPVHGATARNDGTCMVRGCRYGRGDR